MVMMCVLDGRLVISRGDCVLDETVTFSDFGMNRCFFRVRSPDRVRAPLGSRFKGPAQVIGGAGGSLARFRTSDHRLRCAAARPSAVGLLGCCSSWT